MIPALKGDFQFAQLRHARAKLRAVLLQQPFLGHGTSRHGGGRQPGRRAAATARVTNAVFVPVGVVGVARAKALRDVAVILAALVGVANEQGNGGACGLAFVHPRENFHGIGLVALRNVPAGAWAAAVQVDLDIGLGQRHARRAAINHAADGWTMGFTKIGDSEKGA